MGCLYRLTFPNGKSYIGVTMQDFAARLRQHKRFDKRCPNRAIALAMRKYGRENVKADILVVSDSKEYLAFIEKRAVEAFQTLAPQGYNLIPGGNYAPGVYVMPEEQRALRRGWVPSPETRAKMSAAWRGKVHSLKFIEGRALANLGNKRARGRWKTAKGIKQISSGKWRASIAVDGKSYYLGVFDDETGALAARAAAVAAAQSGFPLNGVYAPSPSRANKLRSITQLENTTPSARNTSGYAGVSWYQPTQKWRASYTADGKTFYLGYFKEKSAAAAARAAAVTAHLQVAQ